LPYSIPPVRQIANPLVQTLTTVVDYWQDADRQDWKVKGWTDGQNHGGLLHQKHGKVPVQQEEHFLNGTFYEAPVISAKLVQMSIFALQRSGSSVE
jgi:hypothetical protein